jgi:hypothetical protein
MCFRLSAIAVLLLTLPSCARQPHPTYAVEGVVKFADGSPLIGGSVESLLKAGMPRVVARGPIQADGTFKLTTFMAADGAVEGVHHVIVMPPLPKGDLDELRTQPKLLDPRFSRYETTPLEFTVRPEQSPNRWEIVVQHPSH